MQEVRLLRTFNESISLNLHLKLYYTSNLFFILALGLSKLSVVLFLLGLSPARHHRRVTLAVAAFVGAWTFASLLAVALQCNLASPWILVGETCSGTVRLLPLVDSVPDGILLTSCHCAVPALAGYFSVRYLDRTLHSRQLHLPRLRPSGFNLEKGDGRWVI